MSMPFRVAVIGDAFTDRAEEMTRVMDTMKSGARLVVYGERRLGKTAILRRAADRFSQDGGIAIYMDLWGAAQEKDVLRSLLSQIPTTWLAGPRMTRLLQSLAGMVVLSADAFGTPRLSLDTSYRIEGESGFARLVTKLNQHAGENDEKVALIIDEFQKSTDRLSLPPSSLRRLAQECPHLGFLFSGSAIGTITDLLGPDGPFLGYPTLNVGPIEAEHFSQWIRSVLQEHARSVTPSVAKEIVETANGITSYVLELANECWARTSSGDDITPEVVQAAFASAAHQRTSQFELLWDGVVSTDRAVLTAVSWGAEQLTSGATRARFGLPASSTVTSALKKLRNDALLRPGATPQIADPFFGEWIRYRNPEPGRPGGG